MVACAPTKADIDTDRKSDNGYSASVTPSFCRLGQQTSKQKLVNVKSYHKNNSNEVLYFFNTALQTPTHTHLNCVNTATSL